VLPPVDEPLVLVFEPEVPVPEPLDPLVPEPLLEPVDVVVAAPVDESTVPLEPSPVVEDDVLELPAVEDVALVEVLVAEPDEDESLAAAVALDSVAMAPVLAPLLEDEPVAAMPDEPVVAEPLPELELLECDEPGSWVALKHPAKSKAASNKKLRDMQASPKRAMSDYHLESGKSAQARFRRAQRLTPLAASS